MLFDRLEEATGAVRTERAGPVHRHGTEVFKHHLDVLMICGHARVRIVFAFDPAYNACQGP
jgi:hypothetical protein